MRTTPARAFALAASLVWIAIEAGCSGEHLGPGTPTEHRVEPQRVDARATRQRAAAPAARQILFGDLHVHTTFSPDAFVLSLPLTGGSGAHPPADACDYARFCADLDFWSINDHAEGISPQHWSETVDAIQQCNDVAGPPEDPDTVAFLGWEWSQVGNSPETHFGHKNVVLLETARDLVPKRPIAAPRPEFRVPAMPLIARLTLPLLYFEERQRYFDYFQYYEEVESTPLCPHDVDTRELPLDCHEVARDPEELFEKLGQWGAESLVIPHGTSWGLMTPPLSSWELQARPGQHDPSRQRLLEIYSGHGSAEDFRPVAAAERDERGALQCPTPRDGYEPCCHRAGEIIRARCEAAGEPDCDTRAAEARRNHVNAGVAGHYTVPGATVEDWGVCEQCSDCVLPTFSPRHGMSAQYALARGFRFGWIGASDTHAAHAGNGFKEHARRDLSEARAPIGRAASQMRDGRDPAPRSVALDLAALPLQARRYTERGASVLYTGGLAAVHADSRARNDLWDSLQRREVYATSGDRILLWFDLVNAPGGAVPMGAEVDAPGAAPRFRVRAAGAFHQQPGCPEDVVRAIGDVRTSSLCLGECYHPSDERRAITRIEVVRIRAGTLAGSPDDIDDRIEDPWRVLPCSPDDPACEVVFEDEEPATSGTVAYYVRAIQEPTLAVNGGGFRCETDARGNCVRVRPCYADDRTPLDDDCLGEVEERAWSSPIFVTRR